MCMYHFVLRGFTLIWRHSYQSSYVNVVGSPEELSWDGHANLQVHWKVLFVIFNSGDAEWLQNILGKKKKYHTVICPKHSIKSFFVGTDSLVFLLWLKSSFYRFWKGACVWPLAAKLQRHTKNVVSLVIFSAFFSLLSSSGRFSGTQEDLN